MLPPNALPLPADNRCKNNAKQDSTVSGALPMVSGIVRVQSVLAEMEWQNRVWAGRLCTFSYLDIEEVHDCNKEEHALVRRAD